MKLSEITKFRLKWASALIVGFLLVGTALSPILINLFQEPVPEFQEPVPDCQIVKILQGCRFGCTSYWGEKSDASYGIIMCSGIPHYDELKEKGCEIFEEEEVCGFTS